MLKIIASNKININIINGILLTLSKIGCECYMWDKSKKPFFDMMDEKKPDILFLVPNEEQGLPFAQQEFNFKTVLLGINKPQTEYNLWCKPILENDEIKEDKIFLLNEYANTLKYRGDVYESTIHSYDILYFVENLLLLRNNNKIRDILNIVFNDITRKNVKFAIFGDTRLNFNEYIGPTNNYDKRLLMHNCKIGLDFCGENCMDFALFKKPCITLENKHPIFFSCSNIKSIFDHLNLLYRLSNEERKEIGEKAYDYIFKNELTDYHTTSKILKQIGYNDLGEKCLKTT